MRNVPESVRGFSKRFARRRSRSAVSPRTTLRKLFGPGTPPDVASVRQKSQRHGKVTADRWNQ